MGESLSPSELVSSNAKWDGRVIQGDALCRRPGLLKFTSSQLPVTALMMPGLKMPLGMDVHPQMPPWGIAKETCVQCHPRTHTKLWTQSTSVRAGPRRHQSLSPPLPWAPPDILKSALLIFMMGGPACAKGHSARTWRPNMASAMLDWASCCGKRPNAVPSGAGRSMASCCRGPWCPR